MVEQIIAETNITPEKGDSKLILIIEDEEELQNFISEHLRDLGYEVATATDGMEGLEKARTIDPDLILLDVILPRINGFMICRLLKYDRNFKDIPVIMWTWKDRDADRRAGIESGADAYIPKPFSLNNLMDEIRNIIGMP